MDDVRTVMDAADMPRAAILGVGAGGPMSILFAATHPERTSALVLVNSYARVASAPDYAFGIPAQFVDRAVEWSTETWGTGASFAFAAPSLAQDRAAREFHGRLQRLSVSPGALRRMQAMLVGADVRSVLPSVQVPTLIVHRVGDRMVTIDHGRYLANNIPGAKLIELPGEDHAHYVGDTTEMVDGIQEFLTGVRPAFESERVLATVLFTDIVGSTEQAAAIGDSAWRELMDRHDASVRAQLQRFRGEEVHTNGDGFLASFDGPARAIRCACAIRDALVPLGVRVRAGIHTGEVERRGTDLAGISVHIGSRVADRAEPGEVLVSRTVVDLVVGSGIRFAERGMTTLKGVPGEWQLHAVESV
jgi:class 3 adenylate cyclase